MTDKSGRTALHWAAIGGFAETCTFLLENGADLFAKTSTDMNPLHAACEAQKVDVVKALFASCVDEEAKTKISNETCEGKTAWDIASASKSTPLCEGLKDAGDTNAASAACVIC
jgi:ankyrin repeat protein